MVSTDEQKCHYEISNAGLVFRRNFFISNTTVICHLQASHSHPKPTRWIALMNSNTSACSFRKVSIDDIGIRFPGVSTQAFRISSFGETWRSFLSLSVPCFLDFEASELLRYREQDNLVDKRCYLVRLSVPAWLVSG